MGVSEHAIECITVDKKQHNKIYNKHRLAKEIHLNIIVALYFLAFARFCSVPSQSLLSNQHHKNGYTYVAFSRDGGKHCKDSVAC